jgi:hypothetical protein
LKIGATHRILYTSERQGEKLAHSLMRKFASGL